MDTIHVSKKIVAKNGLKMIIYIFLLILSISLAYITHDMPLNHHLNNKTMTPQEVNQKIMDRVNEMLLNPEIQKQYQAQPSQDAEQWIFNLAIFTLMYSHEERIERSKD